MAQWFGLWSLLIGVAQAGQPSASHSIAHGPGLRPDRVVLPCRYFTIEPHNARAQLLVAQAEHPPTVNITGRLDSNGRSVPVHAQLLRIPGGSWLVRYQTFGTFLNLEIEVQWQGRHISGSPFRMTQAVQPSHCPCPRENFNIWLADLACPERLEQIQIDLAPFPQLDVPQALVWARERFHQTGAHSFCHYVVRDNAIFRDCYGEHVGFNMFADSFLKYLTSVVRLPDVEFLINLGDWPLVDKNKAPLIPMISWCKTGDFADILLPTYEITEASLECMGRQMLDLLSLQANANVPWVDRVAKGFFRGRDSRQARLELVRLGLNHTHLLDVGITRYFFFRDQEAVLGTKPSLSMFDFFKFKYQINMDGTVAAYRFPYLLAGGSLILKQDSDYFEHFYPDLKPWTHYVPFKSDLSDLVEKIEWAQTHDQKARDIADNGRKYAQEHLMPRDVVCYHALLLKAISQRLKHPPEVRSTMDRVELTPKGTCNCHSQPLRDELYPPKELVFCEFERTAIFNEADVTENDLAR
eukprot:maker-scaffold1187_size56475-snap-gene-0.12 protein:Tk02810 transcript:maker-scaffold1187_size56475-snap-gene-0.12-mRNA-1 annotation:"hypothetical protein DAPPUDRAFT_314403"